MTAPQAKPPVIVHVYHCKTQSCPNDRFERIQPKGSTKDSPVPVWPLPCSICGRPFAAKPKVIERVPL